MPGVSSAEESHTVITAASCQARTQRAGAPSLTSLSGFHHQPDKSWERGGERGGQSHNRDNGAFDCDDNSVIIIGHAVCVCVNIKEWKIKAGDWERAKQRFSGDKEKATSALC